jgi:hypothetical protein
MTNAFPEAAVQISPRLLRDSPGLPDPKDEHVVLAAQSERAPVVVTFNLRHFPKSAVEPLGIEVWSPDDFLVSLLKQNRMRMMEVLDAQACAIGQTRVDLLGRFRPGLPKFARTAGEEST